MHTVIAVIQLQLLHYLNTALPTSVTGCQLIDWSSTQTRKSCCGPIQSTVCHYSMAAIQVCVLEKILSLPVSTSMFSVSPSRSISVWTRNVCAAGFFRHQQLHHIQSSPEYLASVYAFMLSCVNYCNAIFAGVPKTATGRLQWVLNVAARIVSDTRNFDHGLTHLMHNELHWLDIPDRVKYKLGMLMYRCQHDQAPWYPMDHCLPVFDNVFRQHLHSCNLQPNCIILR